MMIPRLHQVYCLKYSILIAFLMIMAKNETTEVGNHEYEKSNSINSVQSSLKSHPNCKCKTFRRLSCLKK